MSSDQPEPPPAEADSWGDGALRAQHLDVDALSAYLDHQLSPEEMVAARAHLATCPACGRELAELRATVALLRELPQYLPRRTFQLGPEHARRRSGRGSAFGGWFERLVPAVPALRIATVAVAVLLVAVIAGDLVSNRGADRGLVLQTGDQPAELVNAPAAEDTLDPAPAPALQAPAAEQARSRPAAIPTTSLADADEEAASFAESASEDGTESAAPASSMAGDYREEDAPGVVSPAPAAEPEPVSPPPSGWRLAQVGLGLALLWLIVSLAGVAWLRRDQSSDS
jgi:hypothetical protein